MTAAPQLIATCWTTAGNVRPDVRDNNSRWSLRDRIDGAARAGYAGSGFWLGDLRAWREEGRTYAALRRHLADSGQSLVELEHLTDWFATGERRERSDAARAEFFRAADELGARHIKVMPPYGDTVPADISEQFAQLCDEAADHGLKIGLEMLPFAALGNLSSALAMVAAADAANGGLLIDIWHVVRSGSAVAEVAQVPGRFIIAAELCDAALAMQGTILEDTICHRRLCGEGEFDVPGFIAALAQAGYDGPFGVEILSDELRRWPLEMAASRTFATSAAQFAT